MNKKYKIKKKKVRDLLKKNLTRPIFVSYLLRMDSSKVGFLGRGLVEFGLFGTNDLMQYKTSEFENKVFCCFFIQKIFNECENSVTYEKKKHN